MRETDLASFPKEKIIFISFEGIEGCGKSTQVDKISKYLKSNTNYNVHKFREPGGTEFGEGLRKTMLDSKNAICPLSEAHLFASSRCQLLTEKVIPLLNKSDNIIIYDRYVHSSIAYQGFGSGLGNSVIEKIHSEYPLNIIPHLTIYFKIDVETSNLRQKKRNQSKDYFESKSDEYYQNILKGFIYCENKYENFKTIDGTLSEEEVYRNVLNLIRNLIDEK